MNYENNLDKHDLKHEVFSDREQESYHDTKLDIIRNYFGLMVMNPDEAPSIHHRAIYREINWLLQIIGYRFRNFNSQEDFEVFQGEMDFQYSMIQIPNLDEASHYGSWVIEHQLSSQDRLFMSVVMAMSLNDALFFALLELLKLPIISVYVGGLTQNNGRRFLPTVQTILYLLAGTDLKKQAEYQLYFRSKAILIQKSGIQLKSSQSMRTGYDDIIDEWKNLLVSLDPVVWQYFLGADMPQPEENKQLPLTLLETSLSLDELVLKDSVMKQLQPIIAFARNGRNFFEDPNISAGFKKGFIVLLHGEPGTGKTLIASTIGKYVGLKTYQLEVAQVISKYIGETSQNMSKVFDELERTINWLQGEPSILFVDEADAIMGKRSEVKDSKDRYANLDVSFLLQRLEKFPGVVILATNFHQNLDDAFKRRIQNQIYIPQPEAPERTQLWTNYLPNHLYYPSENFATHMGEKFALTGAQINNILKQASIIAFSEGAYTLEFIQHIEPAIKSEYIKMGKVYHRPQEIHYEYAFDHGESEIESDQTEKTVNINATKNNDHIDIDSELSPIPNPSSNQRIGTPGRPQKLVKRNRRTERTSIIASNRTLSVKSAIHIWQSSLPEGYSYARRDLASNLAKFYALTQSQIVWVVERAVNHAKVEDTCVLDQNSSINLALEEMRQQLGKVNLLR